MVEHMRVNVYEGPMASLGFLYLEHQIKIRQTSYFVRYCRFEGVKRFTAIRRMVFSLARSYCIATATSVRCSQRHIFLLQNTSLYINCLWLTGVS